MTIVPDEVEGSLARKLNWMLDHAQNEHMLRVDDDVYGIIRWEVPQKRYRRLSQTEIDRLIWQGFLLAQEAGTVMWGINVNADARSYGAMRPFGLLAPILGPWQGHLLEHGIRFDGAMGAKEDYDFWLQAIERYRYTFRMNAYAYMKREGQTGGWHSSRTMERERAWADAIQQKWGRVIQYDESKKNLLDGRISIPIPGC